MFYIDQGTGRVVCATARLEEFAQAYDKMQAFMRSVNTPIEDHERLHVAFQHVYKAVTVHDTNAVQQFNTPKGNIATIFPKEDGTVADIPVGHCAYTHTSAILDREHVDLRERIYRNEEDCRGECVRITCIAEGEYNIFFPSLEAKQGHFSE